MVNWWYTKLSHGCKALSSPDCSKPELASDTINITQRWQNSWHWESTSRNVFSTYKGWNKYITNGYTFMTQMAAEPTIPGFEYSKSACDTLLWHSTMSCYWLVAYHSTTNSFKSLSTRSHFQGHTEASLHETSFQFLNCRFLSALFHLIFVNKPTWCRVFSYMFISILYMFRAAMCPSSGELIVSMRHLVYVTLCRWPSGMQFGTTCIPDGQLHRVTYTRCRIDTINSPDDGHMAARNM